MKKNQYTQIVKYTQKKDENSANKENQKDNGKYPNVMP